MEPSSSSSSFSHLLLLIIFTVIFFSSFKPINSHHVSHYHYINQSRNASVSPPPPPSSTYLAAITQPPLLPAHPPSPFPAFFVIDDSSTDIGDSNILGNLSCVDHLPYGRDFNTHQPTGRISNGRVPVDYLELHFGDTNYLGPSGAIEDLIYVGLNYGFAGPGIICSSGSTKLVTYTSFSQQIRRLMDALKKFRTIFSDNSSYNNKSSLAEQEVHQQNYTGILAQFFPQVSEITPVYCSLMIYTLLLATFGTWYWVHEYDPKYVVPLDDQSGSDSEEDSQPSTEEEYSDIESKNECEHRTRLQERLADEEIEAMFSALNIV